jgi:hypothetical protein
MRYIFFLLGLLFAGSAFAQSGAIVIPTCGTAAPGTGFQNLYMDTTGKLCTSATGSGSGSNAAASATGSAVPADAGYTGINVGGNLVGVSNTYPMPIQGVSGGVPAPVTDSAGDNFASVVTAITNSAITYPTPAAAPTVSASGAVTSLVLKASATAGGVKYFHAENGTTTAGYCILYNGTTAPSTGALTAANVLAFQLLPASGYCDVERDNVPVAASTGAVVLLSSASTPFTYTTGAITGSIYGLAQ